MTACDVVSQYVSPRTHLTVQGFRPEERVQGTGEAEASFRLWIMGFHLACSCWVGKTMA